jgi:serine/threonine protein kinase
MNEPATTRNPSPKREIPARIGRYQILERVGRGAMGVVYRANDDKLGRTVAIKVMAADLESEPETRARFEREAKIGGQLLHRNVTTVFDLGDWDGRLYIVMEFLQGVPLNVFLEQPGGVLLEVKLDVMVQLCEGLSAAHHQGVFHRDIKPSNLYVLRDGTLKILDFGIARLATSTMTATGLVIGTADYMSPEQTMGRDVDQRSDLFSAGSVFYFMLTGRKPFSNDNEELQVVLRNVQRENAPPIERRDAPPALAAVVQRALMKRREDRPQSARELVGDLLKFRREWEQETRRVAEQARTSYQAVRALRDEHNTCSASLGLGSALNPDPILAALEDEYPVLAEQGADGFLRIPFQSNAIAGILAQLDAHRLSMEKATAPLRAAADQLRRARALLESGNAREASALLDAAAREAPNSAVVEATGTTAREQLFRLTENDTRIEALTAAARSARASENWNGMLEIAGKLRAIDGGATKADRLIEESTRGIERIAAGRRQALQLALEQGRTAVARSLFDEAERHAQRAAGFATEIGTADATAQVTSLQASIGAARLWANELADATALFRAGLRQDAIAQLQRFHEREPAVAGVTEAIRRFVADTERLAELERRQAEAAASLTSAREALAAGDWARAQNDAQTAANLDPSEEAPYELVVMARVRGRQAANVQAKRAEARLALKDAQALLDAGQPTRAALRAEVAILDDEASAAGSALVAAALHRESEQRLDNLRTRAAREQRRHVESQLREARSAFGKREWPQAAIACEAALAADQDLQEARDIFCHALRRAAAGTIEGLPEANTGVAPDEDLEIDRDRTVVSGRAPGSKTGALPRSVGSAVDTLRTVWRKARGQAVDRS